jgi:hypothetical protein
MSDIQDRIAAARREAENLKARIKAKKEELADADCEQPKLILRNRMNYISFCFFGKRWTDSDGLSCSATGRERDIGALTPYQYEGEKEP